MQEVQKPCITIQVMVKLNHVHQMHMHSGKIGNVFNGTTHHILWKIIYISKML